ncbi:cmr CRISPR-associated ramp protein, Cmr4 family [Thermosipho africanus Ob7]|jgi:CRISPR-associated protein Cmr4|uniref:type III-B CRISPR module RAMP protein Cmr4 n=1 Tax=Thermosipho TaxID=2420 RepID=UPI000E0C26EC|nr:MULTISPECIES: type III-B CRISPR module RAMP protein Cmr4 [Thermosipho]MBZ4649365.1 cmr crispr-associated ramp protein Cmr4 family [Thermosipho sp. (in: thermotogales)]RDI92679.1 cmr CRISPR-associated ramp protein, Cmr4 family [Thermosipho africanus Ob7]
MNHEVGRIGFFYAVTQIHAGKGFDVGIVDQPIQREIHTRFPVINGVKGAIRNEISRLININYNDITQIFGTEFQDNEASEAGKVSFSEGKLAFYPVRSIDRGIVWITCPLILSRLKIAFDVVGLEEFKKLIEKINISYKEDYKALSTINDSKICLEEFEQDIEYSEDLMSFVNHLRNIFPDERLFERFSSNLVILSDEDFSYFVTNSTEVIARIRINPQKRTVDKGALWYEEYIPQDSVLFFISKLLVNDADYLLKKIDELNSKFLNIGGNASIGKGIVYISFLPFKGEDKNEK